MSALRPRHPSIVHALFANAERGAQAPSTIFAPERVGDSAADDIRWRHDDLAVAACRSAAALASAGVRPGDRVMLCLPTSPEFVTAFFGALVLGAVPTAVATPGGFGSSDLFYDKFRRLAAYLEPRAVIASAGVLEAAGLGADLTAIDSASLHGSAVSPTAPALAPRMPEPDEIAFIQSTSGSTGTPKGVQITHANLAANCEQIAVAASMDIGDTWVGWLPLHHDMGLIGGFLTPVFTANDAVVMPPSRFLRKPGDWLRAVGRYRGTFTAAPNFAYGYAAARVTDEEMAGVDLSSWRFLFCGAEPIHAPTVQRFIDRFKAWGLPEDALVPCYGMAEASLAVTVSRPHAPVAFDSISRRALTADGLVVDVDVDDPDAMQIVDCGEPVLGTEVRIVDADNLPVIEDVVGRIQFRGPSTTVGYFRLPEATASSRAQDWWDTGDIGYLRAGRLRITGRQKDLIIIRGANYLPTDFEIAAEEVPGVRPGGAAAVGYADAEGLSEDLYLIVESAVDPAAYDELRRAVRVAVSKRTGILAADVVVVPPRGIPKTTSGKVQRAQARALFVERGAPEPVGAGGAG
ncbi:fatty acyl-AMP ligase [Nocardia noduli]|uniref:fatty acyl-AMP ligase n=1 Tax=Nocardia noduli TaxID=2815722 RepID=UPI001C224659|nr:fatty acyl-AMP ligase [Nocardia noduli]